MPVRVGDARPPRVPSLSGSKGKGKPSDIPNTANEGVTKVKEAYQGITAEQGRDWVASQLNYENLADNAEVADRAIHFHREHLRRYEDKTITLRNKWRTIQYVLRGNTISRWGGLGEVHVPEVYKMVETLIPRLVGALTDYDPWFHVRGRESSDKKQEAIIREHLRYQLQEARWRSMLEPSLRDMLAYGFCAFKVWWEHKEDWRVTRKVEREPGPDGFEYTITRKRERKVVSRGPRIQLIDPYDFIIDTTASNPRDALFVGNRYYMTYDEIAAMGELGIFKNTDELVEADPQRPANDLEFYKLARALTWTDENYVRQPDGGPRLFEIVDLYGLFDLYDTPGTVESVLTVANQGVVLRAQENPNDEKTRPFAVARAAKEGHEFFSVGPLDHSIRPNLELDDHRNLALQAHRLSVNPLVFVGAEADVPDSLFNVEPGAVFRAASPRDVQIMKVPLTIEGMQYIDGTIRRDIEETTGAPRIFEGTGSGDSTATGIERRIQMGNKRLEGLLRSYSDCTEDILRIMHCANRQNLTQAQTFRVLGKAAHGLSEYEQVTPHDYSPDVDFEFVGLSRLKNLGLRATQMVQFLSIAQPYIEQHPGIVNTPALIADLYKEIVDVRPGDQIVREQTPLDELLAPEEENVLFLQGQEVEINELDPHAEHITYHRMLDESPGWEKTANEDMRNNLSLHILGHEQALRQEAIRQMAIEQAPPSMVPGQPLPAQANSAAERMPQNQSPARTQPGENPGPPDMQKQAVPGRSQPMTQTDNMMETR